MQAWPGRGSDVSCLSGLLCFARSFRSSFFLSLPPPHPHHPPPPPPGNMRGRGSQNRAEGRERGQRPQLRKGPLSLPTDPDHHPPSRGARVKADRARAGRGHWDLGTLGHWDIVQPGSPGRAPEKGTWRKRRPEYVLTHPSSPTQSNPGRASFLPFHIHIPCRTGTGSGTGTTLDRE